MLEIRNVNVCYGEVEVLHNLTLKIPKGEIVAIVGANGAGKTTLLKTISGMMSPASGEIRFQGELLNSLPPHKVVGKGIAHIPEGRRLFPLLSVRDNLLLGAYIPSARKSMNETLAEVFKLFPKLKEREDQLAGTLSGGEQQMVTIGRGLMSRPKILMFDEPSLGLAPQLVHETFKTVQQIRERGSTILLVEQN
ncbi:MAG: ABC transporter ATP-binding protein, partial [Deltaproteobacteria bacterium]|nr:ABC transporter ATP-binding protein [Deltaproteobacteria bacterium]